MERNGKFRMSLDPKGPTPAVVNANRQVRRSAKRKAAVVTLASLLGVPLVSATLQAHPASAACVGVALPANSVTMDQVNTIIDAKSVKAQGITGAGIDVAVVDTGVTPVPGLAGPGKIADGADLSFDGNDPTTRYRDHFGHGTAMASIIAGDASNGPKYEGVAPGARIVNLKAGAGDGAADVSNVVAALDWIAQNKNTAGRNIRVANLAFDVDSFSGADVDVLNRAVRNLWRSGVFVVVSGGNDGTMYVANPAKNALVMAVGSADLGPTPSTFYPSSFSALGNLQRSPDLIAPGRRIVVPAVGGSFLSATYASGNFVDPTSCLAVMRGSGTSQAAAVTAGAAALLFAQRPSLTNDQVKDLLTATSTPMNASLSASYSTSVKSRSMINVGAASRMAARPAEQTYPIQAGFIFIDQSRGSHGIIAGASYNDSLRGEVTAFNTAFNGADWAPKSDSYNAWSGLTFDSAGRMMNGTWSGATWTNGAVAISAATTVNGSSTTWAGRSWSGRSWSGRSWSGRSWSGGSWSGVSTSWASKGWSSAGWN
jgi:serine protease AprX